MNTHRADEGQAKDRDAEARAIEARLDALTTKVIKIEVMEGSTWRVWGRAYTGFSALRMEDDARKTWLHVRRVEG